MNDWKFSSLYENRKKRRFFCRFIVLVRRVWQSQDNEKCQRTKDKDKKCYQRWWSSAKTSNPNSNVNVDDRSGKTRQNILFEVSSKIFSLNWLTQHFPVWIYGSFVNRGVLTTDGNIINIINFQIWSNPQRENTFNIFNNGKNMIKSSGITYNSKLEAPSKKSYGGIVNGHHLREDEC